MCGIVGVRFFDGSQPDAARLRTAASVIAHRGPDGDGCIVRRSVGLAHRRLAIIDTAASMQPMTSRDGKTHVCFNGEILNYRELRARSSYSFHTQGDTEVLLATYLDSGPLGVERLVGQFAYAIYDEQSDDLWLYRDRVGILPLYYYSDAQKFVFASEIKALLTLLDHPPEVDHESLDAYLLRRAVPAPWTMFRGIRKLPAGHSMRVTSRGAEASAPYWKLPGPEEEIDFSAAEAATRLARALESAVARNLVADVPVGAYLSGGVDSSLIVALASQRGSGGLETFAAGFGDPRYDELPEARRVSEQFGTRHHEVVMQPSDFAGLWEKLTWHRDAPISEASDVAVYRLAQLARQHVKVVLSGEGSDELFAGYPKSRFANVTSTGTRIPTSVRRPLLNWVERRLPERGGRGRIALRALAEANEAERYATWFAPFTGRERATLLGTADRHPDSLPDPGQLGDPLRRMLVLDTLGWLPDNLLERADRMSMAASLEVRPVFLDLDVVELAFRMPSHLKLRGGQTKWIVKEVARTYLPSDIVDRRKVGFRVPLDRWFRGGLREFGADRLLDRRSFVQTVFDGHAVRTIVDSHLSGRRNEESRMWTLLSLEIWHDVFFRSPSTVGFRPSDTPVATHAENPLLLDDQ